MERLEQHCQDQGEAKLCCLQHPAQSQDKDDNVALRQTGDVALGRKQRHVNDSFARHYSVNNRGLPKTKAGPALRSYKSPARRALIIRYGAACMLNAN